MFTINQRGFGDFKEIILENSLTGEFVSIIPDVGATINQLFLSFNKKLYSIIDGADTFEDFLNFYIPKYAGVKLFPFPNRVSEARYRYNNNNYKLNANDQFPLRNALHKFVNDKTFKVTEKFISDEFAILNLSFENDRTIKGYPFQFSLNISYKLSKNGLEVLTRVKNTDSKTIPIGDGWHPYITTGTKINKLLLKIPAKRYFETNDQFIPTGKLIEISEFNKLQPIGNKDFNDCFKVDSSLAIIETILFDPELNLEIIIWQENKPEKYRYIQYYTPPDRMSLAIEPMTCAPDAINNNYGLIHLEPNKEASFTFGIKLKNN